MKYHILEYFLLLALGLIAGIINTLAGNGSLVTLAAMMFLGLPVDVANATNRVGTFFQSISASYSFQRQGIGNLAVMKKNAFFIVAGALSGTGLALYIPPDSLQWVLGYLMIAMLFVVLFNPQKWLREKDIPNQNVWIEQILLFSVSFYGGFLQAGVGVLLLSAMVLGAGYSIKTANSIKINVVLLLTVPSLALFIYSGLIEWQSGLTLALGQSLGSIVASRLIVRFPKINVLVRWLLIAIISISILKIFGAFKLLEKMIE